MKPYTLISSDCHAAPPMVDYRTFVEPRFRDDFDPFELFYECPKAGANQSVIISD